MNFLPALDEVCWDFCRGCLGLLPFLAVMDASGIGDAYVVPIDGSCAWWVNYEISFEFYNDECGSRQRIAHRAMFKDGAEN